MYLLTFTFLLIGVLGIYTQVLALQTEHMFQKQTNVADTVISWHEAALSLADNVVNSANYPTLPASCSLTLIAGACQHTALVGGSVAGTNVNVAGDGTYTFPNPGGLVYPHLAGGFSGVFEWKSTAFQNAGIYYVITYVDPPAANGLISSAIGPLGITQGDFYRQIQNTGLSNSFYGYVSPSGGTLMTTASVNGVPTTYTIPGAATITPGSFGIISISSPCNGC